MPRASMGLHLQGEEKANHVQDSSLSRVQEVYTRMSLFTNGSNTLRHDFSQGTYSVTEIKIQGLLLIVGDAGHKVSRKLGKASHQRCFASIGIFSFHRCCDIAPHSSESRPNGWRVGPELMTVMAGTRMRV